MDATVAKTYDDGTVDISTLPVTVAREHVKARTAAADHFGIVAITVEIDRKSYRWTATLGWS